MSSVVANRLFINDHEAHLATEVLRELEGPAGVMFAGRADAPVRLPDEIGRLVQTVLQASLRGSR